MRQVLGGTGQVGPTSVQGCMQLKLGSVTLDKSVRLCNTHLFLADAGKIKNEVLRTVSSILYGGYWT